MPKKKTRATVNSFFSSGLGATILTGVVVASVSWCATQFMGLYRESGAAAATKSVTEDLRNKLIERRDRSDDREVQYVDADITDLRNRIASLETAVRNCRQSRE